MLNHQTMDKLAALRLEGLARAAILVREACPCARGVSQLRPISVASRRRRSIRRAGPCPQRASLSVVLAAAQ